jgi:hypothetical protein
MPHFGKTIWLSWKKTFIATMIIFVCISIISICSPHISKLINFYFSVNIIKYISLILILIVFYLHQKKWFEKITSWRYNRLLNFLSEYIFIISLILIFLNNIISIGDNNLLQLLIKIFGDSAKNNIEILREYLYWPIKANSYLIGTTIISGSLSLWLNYSKIIKKISEKDHLRKLAKKAKRYQRIKKAFPSIEKSTPIKPIVGWLEKNGLKFHFVLLIIAILFIGIKVWMPIYYEVSYVDEYFHTASGSSLFETGNFAEFSASEGTYKRGAIMSVLTGAMIYFGGKNLFLVKLIPALIGIINFFLFYLIAKKIINNRTIIILALSAFTLSPWIIFNHFYIRFYVIYELFILLILYLFSLLVESLKEKNKKIKIISLVSIIVLLNIIIYYSSYDLGKYSLMIVTITGFMYLFISTTKNRKTQGDNEILKHIKAIFQLKILYKIILIIFLSIILFFIFKVPSKIYLLINHKTSTLAFNMKYLEFFFAIQWIFTLFIIIALPIITITKNKFKKILVISTSLLLLLHLSSNYDMQIIRGILYLIPVTILVAMISLDNLYYLFKRGHKITLYIKYSIIILMLAVCVYNSYPEDFIQYPNIYNEIIPRDYKKASNFIKEKLKNHTIIDATHGASSSYPSFYDLDIDFHLDLNNHNITTEKRMANKGIVFDPFYYDNAGTMYSTYLNRPHIIMNEFEKIIREEKVVVILIEGSKWQFLTNDSYSLMVRFLPFRQDFLNFSLYYN